MIHSYLVMLSLFILIFIFKFRIVTFLFIGMSAHVLFDSGATRSSVSLALKNKFYDPRKILDFPLEVEITYERPVRASRVHHGYVMNLFSKRYFIDLVLIPPWGTNAIY